MIKNKLKQSVHPYINFVSCVSRAHLWWAAPWLDFDSISIWKHRFAFVRRRRRNQSVVYGTRPACFYSLCCCCCCCNCFCCCCSCSCCLVGWLKIAHGNNCAPCLKNMWPTITFAYCRDKLSHREREIGRREWERQREIAREREGGRRESERADAASAWANENTTAKLWLSSNELRKMYQGKPVPGIAIR